MKTLLSTLKTWLSWRLPFKPRPPHHGQQQAGKDTRHVV